jgi:hypothetical protein
MNQKLMDELNAFQGIWKGGYFGGDPLDPVGKSTYGQLGFMSVIHATYLRCIKPYVNGDTVAVEIGPGRGAWTKALLPAREVYALDALPEEYNRFFEYLEHPKHVKYFQVADFKCAMLPDNYFNYMFSFGTLCHVSFEGIKEYAVNLYPKIKSGSNCFWMVADYDKYNQAVSRQNELNVCDHLAAYNLAVQTYPPLMRWVLKRLIKKWILPSLAVEKIQPKTPDKDDNPKAGGRWYHAGIRETCAMLTDVGYSVVDPDVGTCLRDPVIHFVKP